MNSRARSTRRDPENIAFARDQRARANEFAQDVWQMVRSRRCRNQKFRREYPIPPYTADFCCVALKLIVEVMVSIINRMMGNPTMRRATNFWPSKVTKCCGILDIN